MTDLSSILDFKSLDRTALHARYTDLLNIVRELERLEHSVGWKILQDLILANAAIVGNERTDAYFTSLEAVFKDQFMKGTAKGLKAVLTLLPASLEAYRAARDEIATVLQQEDKDGSSARTEPEPDGSTPEPEPAFAP